MYRAAPAHVHSAHAAYQLLEHRMHSHNPPTPWAGLARVFFCCVLLHVYRGVILDLTAAASARSLVDVAFTKPLNFFESAEGSRGSAVEVSE